MDTIPGSNTPASDTLVMYTKRDLITLCKERGIEGTSRLNKFEIIALLTMIDEITQDQRPEIVLEEEEEEEEEEISCFNKHRFLIFSSILAITLYNISYIRF